MSIGPFQSLFSCKNGGTVTRSEGHQLAAFGHTCSAATGSITVAGDGPTDVGAVTGRGVGVSRLGPTNTVKFRRVNRLLAGPGLEVIVVRVTGIHAGVEVHDGRTVAVPFGKGQVHLVLHLARWRNDGSAPRIRGRHHVGGFVHHDARVGCGFAAPLRWQVEEFQRFVEFQVLHPVPVRQVTHRLNRALNQPTVDQGGIPEEGETQGVEVATVLLCHR